MLRVLGVFGQKRPCVCTRLQCTAWAASSFDRLASNCVCTRELCPWHLFLNGLFFCSVFHKLEETRVQLEDTLGPIVFTKTYRMIQAWREADDDDDSDARRKDIEQILETKQNTQSFPKLLHLVVSDATHYEINTSDEMDRTLSDDDDFIFNNLDDSESLSMENVVTEDGDADIEGATPVTTVCFHLLF